MFVTVYQPDSYNRIENLLKKGNIVVKPQKNKGNLQLASSIHVPSVLNKLPFAPNIPQVEDVVKNVSERHGRTDTVSYKLPIGEDGSPRALLANACIITNDIEKQKIREYKSKAEMLDTKKIKAFQDEARKTANRFVWFV